VITYSVSRWWLWYQRVALTFTIGGGCVMLALAAVDHAAAAVWLLVMGLAWLAIGCLGLRQYRGCAQQVSLDGTSVKFSGPGSEVVVPMTDVVEVRRAWGDLNRLGPLTVVIANQAPIRIAPRICGLFDVFADLRRVNPDVRLPEF
jgi:hypothetical protein